MGFIAVYVTHQNREEAEKIASSLLNRKLIACANFFPISSSFWWQGEANRSEETVTLLKTRTGNWESVQAAILEMHPYEVPCIMKFEVEANSAYESWIESETA